jgi:uncharacterized protein
VTDRLLWFLFGLLVLFTAACSTAAPESTSAVIESASPTAVASVAVPPTSIELVPLPGFDDGTLTVVTAAGDRLEYPVLVARTAEQRTQGMMGVLDLGGYAGMVFVFEEDTEAGFWMRDTSMPLSIAFLTFGGRVVSTADMEPCLNSDECPRYLPAGPYRRAFEVPQGQFESLGVSAGSVLILSSG